MIRFPYLSLILSVALSSAALAAQPKYPFNPAPSADLNYAIKARQSGLTLDGSASLQWRVTDSSYSIRTETRAMLVGKILDATSEGAIDEYGLAPASSTEKRFRKDAATTTFNRADKTIVFSAAAASYPIKGGEQDRNSIIWQLIGAARAAPGKFKARSEWHFFVAGQHDAENWTFQVQKSEKINTPLGDANAVHITKMPPPDSKSQQLDIWLAPALDWYPVRLRYTDPDGDYIEQLLESVSKK